MQTEINKLEFVLENCEVVVIDGEYIGSLNIGNIERSIRRVACNAISDMQICRHFSISINRNAEDDEKSGSKLFNQFGKKSPLHRLIQYCDITSIYVHFADNRVEQFYVKWDGDECENYNQKSYINKFGDLFVVIDKDMKLDDVFNLNEIEEEDYMNFVWSIYS